MLGVRLWQIVTVASCAARSMSAMGLPTMVRATEHHGLACRRRRCRARASRRMTPGGRAGPRAGEAAHKAAEVHGMEAVDVLLGRDVRRWPRSASRWHGSGICTRMPLTAGVGVEHARAGPRAPAWRAGGRQVVVVGVDAAFRRSPCACCARRPQLAGSSPTSTTASPQGWPFSFRAATRTATSRFTLAATALPSRTVAMGVPFCLFRHPRTLRALWGNLGSRAPGSHGMPAGRTGCSDKTDRRRREGSAVAANARSARPADPDR